MSGVLLLQPAVVTESSGQMRAEVGWRGLVSRTHRDSPRGQGRAGASVLNCRPVAARHICAASRTRAIATLRLGSASGADPWQLARTFPPRRLRRGRTQDSQRWRIVTRRSTTNARMVLQRETAHPRGTTVTTIDEYSGDRSLRGEKKVVELACVAATSRSRGRGDSGSAAP